MCVDGIVFTTDTRVTMMGGFIAHRKGKKVHKIDEHLGMTIAGVVADAQNAVDILRYYAGIYRLERKAPMPVSAAARLTSNMFFSQRVFPYIADVLIGGHDGLGASLYNIDLFGSLTKEKFVSTGSGSPVAYGILESEYDSKMPVSKGLTLAVKAVTSAMKRNAMTGDSFDAVVIGKKGYTELSEERKKETLATILGRS